VSAAEYDEEASDSDVRTCAELPGATPSGVDTSLPPGLSIRFEGTEAEQKELEECLRALPDTRSTGPFELPAER
jgi:HSP20 family molecular chaperone IbpA